jgi:hypothetical protein
MWNKNKTKGMISKVISKYGKEIGIEGSNAVLGLEEHLDIMVANLMGLDLEVVKIARQWRLIIERAAITEGFDKIKALLEAEENKELAQTVKEPEVNEVEMKIEVEERSGEEMEMETKEKGKQRDMEDVKEIIEEREIEVLKESTKSEEQNIKEMFIDNYVEVSLDKSIWAPKIDRCENTGEIQAKVAAINILGDNSKHREKSLRWALRGNTHIRKIGETFENGNLWCTIVFDCEKGYKEAKRKLENAKEEIEKCRLIPRVELRTQEGSTGKMEEFSSNKKKTQEKTSKDLKKKETESNSKEENAQIELEEVFRKRKSLTKQDLSHRIVEVERSSSMKSQISQRKGEGLKKEETRITIWDLPIWAKRPQVFESVRSLGRVDHIEIIRDSFGKTRAEISFFANTLNIQEIEETWCLPFMNNYLVRITVGKNNYEELKIRNKFSRRLVDLPENVNEVLLWRQVRRTKAKSVHIFKNTNNNNRRSATIFFENEEDLLNSSKFAVFYYNNKLRWDFRTPARNKNLYERKLRVSKQVHEERQNKETKKLVGIDRSTGRILEDIGEIQEVVNMESSEDEETYERQEEERSYRESSLAKKEPKKTSQREKIRNHGISVSSETNLRLMFEKFIAFSEREGIELENEEAIRETKSPNRS